MANLYRDRTFTCWVTQKVSVMAIRLHDFPLYQALPGAISSELLARTEIFELPTAWFVVSKLIANILFFKIDYWNARCPFCLTMQDDA